MKIVVRFFKKVNVSEGNLDKWISVIRKTVTKESLGDKYNNFVKEYTAAISKGTPYIDKLKFACQYLPTWDPNEEKYLPSKFIGKCRGPIYLQETASEDMGIPAFGPVFNKKSRTIVAKCIQDVMDAYSALEFYNVDGYKLGRLQVENYARSFFNSCESYYGEIYLG